MADAPETPTTARLSGQARVALIGAAVSVVIAAGAFAVYPLVIGASTSADGASGGATAPSELTDTATPTPTATQEPIAPHTDRPRTFGSQSGNLQCSMWMYSGQPTAICQQREHSYARPAEACQTDSPGVFVGVTADGPYWPCVSNWSKAQEVLPYDTPATYGDLTCSINYVTGVTCTNSEGHGFTMEYDAGIQHF